MLSRVRQSGFTLIEILAVMFIIAVAVAALQPNFGTDKRLERLREEAQRWSVMFELIAQEAVLTGKDYGVAFHTNGAQIYLHRPLTLEEIEEMQENVSNKKPRHEWEPYHAPPFKFLSLPETVSFAVAIEGQSAIIAPALTPEDAPAAENVSKKTEKSKSFADDDDEPKPHLVFFSGGEQQSLEVNFFWDDVTDDVPLELETLLTGDGLGRFRVSERNQDDA